MLPGLSGVNSIVGAGLAEELESPGALFFLSALFLQSGGMDFSRVGERLLSSVRSARSLGVGILPSAPHRPEVPARAAAAAAIARALAGIPPHQRINLLSSSEELISIYGSRPSGQSVIEDLEEDFYEEDFDPVKHVLNNIPSEGNELNYLEEKATLRLMQLDRIAERLSRHVMEHHEEMVKGMQLVMELEQDLKIANVICMNGRRHLTSSMHEVSQDLVVHSNAKKKQNLLDMLPILTELRHALDMQMELDVLVEEGNYFRAFQLLSEYLQVLDSFPDLTVMHEMSRGVEAWLERTLQKLDSLLLGVCQNFKDENYLTAIDAYAIIGDMSGLAEKIQSFFMQEVLAETHLVLKNIVEEDIGQNINRNRFTYSDLCGRIPESKFRQCLLSTLDILFKLMCSYYAIMSFQPENNDSKNASLGTKLKALDASESSDSVLSLPSVSSQRNMDDGLHSEFILQADPPFLEEEFSAQKNPGHSENGNPASPKAKRVVGCASEDVGGSRYSPFYQLRKDTTTFVAKTLDRGRKNLCQLTTSRLSVLLSSPAICSTSTHQFLRVYEDLNIFILAGEAFCGVEAVEFRQRLKTICESYITAFHRQNIHALKLVLEKETWAKITSDAMHVISLAGLVGDGAPLIAPSSNNSMMSFLHTKKTNDPIESGSNKNGFANWLRIENPFVLKALSSPRETSYTSNLPNEVVRHGLTTGSANILNDGGVPNNESSSNHSNRSNSALEDENEDLLADFIDEDSQLPSRIPKPMLSKSTSAHWNDEEVNSQTGSSLCLLRLMDKYARLMQKLEIVNLEFFKGICQLFGFFFLFVYETFGERDITVNGKGFSDPPSSYVFLRYPARLKLAISRVLQDCGQLIRQQGLPCSPTSSLTLNGNFTQMDVTLTAPNSSSWHSPNTNIGLKERCAGAETILLVARVLHKARSHLQSMLSSNNASLVEEFFESLVDAVPDLVTYIHQTTARQLLHIHGYADRIASAKWEVKELGLEHNSHVDLLLGEFKHYKTRLAHGGIQKEVQDLLLVHGLDNVAEILVEGLSRVKRCTDEGRALMSLDLQVLINGLQHFVPINVRPKLQVVETFIKAYYLPETEFVYWARSHPEYNKGQVIGLVNLVATMKSWKRKTRLEVIEKLEAGT